MDSGQWLAVNGGRSQYYCGGLDCGLPLVAFWQHNANAKCSRVHACTRSMPSSIFTGRIPFLPLSQQRQSTEGRSTSQTWLAASHLLQATEHRCPQGVWWLVSRSFLIHTILSGHVFGTWLAFILLWLDYCNSLVLSYLVNHSATATCGNCNSSH